MRPRDVLILLLLLSFLPIWRSGEKYGLNLADYATRMAARR
jgi:hypothetical protein